MNNKPELETDEKRKAFIKTQWENMKTPGEWFVCDTIQVPDDVVSKPLFVWASWIPTGAHRVVTQTVALQLGEIDNPALTPDEAQRVACRLLDLAAFIWREYGDEREPPKL